MARRDQPRPKPLSGNTSGFPWLGVLLAVSIVSLVFQLFPSVWWGLLAIVDIRSWSWRSWAVASAVWIVCLVGMKTWRDANSDR